MFRAGLLLAALVASAVSASGGGAYRPSAPSTIAGVTFRECAHCPQMIVVPAGQFLMGSPDTEVGRFEKEGPVHQVMIKRSFAIGVYSVTRSEYSAFVNSTGHASGGCGVFDGKEFSQSPSHDWTDPGFKQTNLDPVVCVNLEDAHAYVNWINARIGSHANNRGSYRLLSEAEWEYAARGGTTTPYWWGTTIRRDHANYGPDERRFAPFAKDEDHWLFTSPGNAYPANAFGIHDMAGNVFEWTEDCAHASYDGAPIAGEPWLAGNCKARIVRGGSWLKPPTGERSAMRGEKEPRLRISEIGFRVAKSFN